MGVPIAFSLGLTAVVGLWQTNPGFLIAIPQKLFSTSSNYSLMAIPLFILAGELMGLSGDVVRLMNLARALIGRVKGGLAYVSIILGMFLGGLLGMANAVAALLSTTIFPEMTKDGYEEEFCACFIGAVSIIGPLIPPGLLLVIYGVASNTSIAELFMAGVVPGIMVAAALSLVIFISGKKADWPVSEPSSLKDIFKASKKAAFSVLAPFITFVSIAYGVATATEAAAVVCVLVFLVGAFVYKKIKLKDMSRILIRTATISGAILMISAMGGVLGWNLAIAMIPQTIARSISSVSNNPLIIILLIQIMLFFVGMVMDSAPAVMILVPVLMPVIKQYGIDPVHFGLLMCFNLSIGLLTPPVGTVLYTTSTATGVSADKMVKSIWPWVIVLAVVLLFVTYVPDSIMWLPRLFAKN
jgi:tripartite ATP-independent transporter DctM subunit